MVIYVESKSDSKLLYVGFSTNVSIIGGMVLDNNKLLMNSVNYPLNLINDLFSSRNPVSYVVSLLDKYIILFLEEYPNMLLGSENIEVRSTTMSVPLGHDANLQEISLKLSKSIQELNKPLSLDNLLNNALKSYKILVDSSNNRIKIQNMKSERKPGSTFDSIIEFKKTDTYLTNALISSIEIYNTDCLINRLKKMFDNIEQIDIPLYHTSKDMYCFIDIMNNNKSTNCTLDYSLMIALNSIIRMYKEKLNTLILVTYYQYGLQEYIIYTSLFLSKKKIEDYKKIIEEYIKRGGVLRISDVNDIEMSVIKIEKDSVKKRHLRDLYI